MVELFGGAAVHATRLLLNSLLLVVVAVPVAVVVTSMAGFAIVTARGQLRRWLAGVSVLMLFVPAAALWVPRVVLLRSAGLVDTRLTVALLALAGTTPFYVLLFALAYSRIPASAPALLAFGVGQRSFFSSVQR